MKQIWIVLALSLVAVSCGKSSETANVKEETALTQTDTLEVGADTVDAVTSATAVANAPSFNGVIMLPPEKHATVTLMMDGTIQDIHLFPGEYVKKGAVIATLKNPDFIRLQQEYLDAAAQVEYLEKEYERQRNLTSHEAASQKKLQQSKAEYLSMKARLDASVSQLEILGISPSVLQQKGMNTYLEIKAPISGYVTNMRVNVGKYFNVGEPICDVIDKSALMLQLTAYEKDLDKLKVGDIFDFHVNGMGGKTFKATLLSIDQMVDNTNRSIKIYATINHPDVSFRPGMYVSARKSSKN